MSTSTTSSTDTQRPGTSGNGWVTLGRSGIDAIDSEIIKLIERRRRLSNAIGVTKADAGLPRVDLKREKEIIERYTLAFGHYGSLVGGSILAISKEN